MTCVSTPERVVQSCWLPSHESSRALRLSPYNDLEAPPPQDQSCALDGAFRCCTCTPRAPHYTASVPEQSQQRQHQDCPSHVAKGESHTCAGSQHESRRTSRRRVTVGYSRRRARPLRKPRMGEPEHPAGFGVESRVSWMCSYGCVVALNSVLNQDEPRSTAPVWFRILVTKPISSRVPRQRSSRPPPPCPMTS